MWNSALDAGKPLVLDADGLNLLAVTPRALPPTCVLTPHPGEAARLLGIAGSEIQADRFAAVRALAGKYRAVVVLKGAGSLVADAGGRVAVCPWGNPGMASGGMGDVLTGVITGRSKSATYRCKSATTSRRRSPIGATSLSISF